MKLGTKVKMLESCGGVHFNYEVDEIIEVTEKNADLLESFVRGGIARELTLEQFQEAQPHAEGDTRENENLGILPDNKPAGKRSSKRSSKSKGS